MTTQRYEHPITDAGGMPSSLRAVRVLLYVTAALTALMTVAILLVAGTDAETLGAATWSALPGVAAFLLARGLHRGGVRRWRLLVGLEVLFVLFALGALGQGDPRGLTGLALPIAVLVLAFRPAARDYMRDPW